MPRQTARSDLLWLFRHSVIVLLGMGVLLFFAIMTALFIEWLLRVT